MVAIRKFLIVFLVLPAVLSSLAGPTARAKPSHCLAVAEADSPLRRAAFRPAALAKDAFGLSFLGHSTFLIESAGGIRIATDYAGWAGRGVIPDVVTMNHAHETHYTDYFDPGIKHVLRGWNPKGGHAEHDLEVGDVRIRNVPTNIRSWDGTVTEAFGNSIFIFELAGLCVGHLGHLQHELTPRQLGQIGQLDVVLVPADGAYTMDLDGMAKVVKQLKARLVIPMHYFHAMSLQPFLLKLQADYQIKISQERSIVLSRGLLPKEPQVLVIPGL